MNQLVAITAPRIPELVAAAGERAGMRFLEFFAGNIRNPHTRRAYARAAEEFLAWCASADVPSIGAVQPVHVATWIEAGTRELAAPSVKQRLAAIRHLFDWLVTGQVVPVNPAASVRGPRHVVTSGQTPVLDPAEARALLDSIDTSTVVGLRDRALIGLMVYSFARIGAALGMTVEDVFTQNRRLWVRLREKGGKRHAMPCHHNLEEYLTAYLDGPAQRSEGAAVPHDRTRHRPAHAHGAAPGERLCDDRPARSRRRHRHQARQSQFPGDRDHRLPQKRRHARKGRRNGESCFDPHDAALRSPARRGEPR
jgi:site-specific recombinase XerC